jgi:hypothetical protein
VVARSFGREVFWSRAFSRECLVAGHLVACRLVVGSFIRVVIWTRGHLVADHLVAGHLVVLNEKSILTYL